MCFPSGYDVCPNVTVEQITQKDYANKLNGGKHGSGDKKTLGFQGRQPLR
jgi:hypothetical protein